MTVRARILWCLLLLDVLVACDVSQSKPPMAAGPLPAEFQAGQTEFIANCSACHGVEATGTDRGPPLVHKIYEPNHHGDLAFQRAVAYGVKAHHWQFENMPKIEGVTSEAVDQIVGYVRWLQRQAGIQ